MKAHAHSRLPPIAELVRIFRYDPESGILYNRIRRGTTAPAGVQTGTKGAGGYLVVRVNRVLYKVHRIIWLMVYGKEPDGDIDHIDGCPSNNRIINLRCVSASTNLKNARIRTDNSTGIVGVSWSTGRGKWAVSIRSSGVDITLGRHSCFLDACAARKSAELKYEFHENHGRSV